MHETEVIQGAKTSAATYTKYMLNVLRSQCSRSSCEKRRGALWFPSQKQHASMSAHSHGRT